MKVLVIPDIHLKPWLFDQASIILNMKKADRAVCLMDIADDWNKQFQTDLYRETYDRAVQFAQDHPDTLWCYGNHDVSYPWGMLESGYSPYAEKTVLSGLEKLEHSLKDPAKIAIMHRIDNVMFAHGGLTEEFVMWLDENLLDSDIDEVLTAVNTAPRNYLWNDISPLWLRPQNTNIKAFRYDTYTQVVGHTPVGRIYEENGFISTDVFSTHPRGGQIGTPHMVVIDSASREYELIKVCVGSKTMVWTESEEMLS